MLKQAFRLCRPDGKERLTDRQMQRLEREQAEEPPPPEAQPAEGPSEPAGGEVGVELEEVEVVNDERGQFPRGSWFMHTTRSRRPHSKPSLPPSQPNR